MFVFTILSKVLTCFCFIANEDLSDLLKDAHNGLLELNLSNNMLTVECLSSITIFINLRILDLSYNTLGPAILQRLPDLLQSMPSLREIKLSGTHLGDFTDIDQDIKEAYIAYGMTAPLDSGLILDLSNNHFHKDILQQWTNILINLKQISGFHLSNISSDTTWDNFDLLSDLPK